MEARGPGADSAELRRIPCGAQLRVNKKSLTILQNKCVQLVQELDRKEETLRQVTRECVCACAYGGRQRMARPRRRSCHPRLTRQPHLAQLSDAVGCMASAKDMVALQLAHKCDELELELAPLKMSSQEAVPALALGLPTPATPPRIQSNTRLGSTRTVPGVPRLSRKSPGRATVPPVGTVVGPASPLTRCVQRCNTARQLQEERAKSAALQEQLRQAQV